MHCQLGWKPWCCSNVRISKSWRSLSLTRHGLLADCPAILILGVFLFLFLQRKKLKQNTAMRTKKSDLADELIRCGVDLIGAVCGGAIFQESPSEPCLVWACEEKRSLYSPSPARGQRAAGLGSPGLKLRIVSLENGPLNPSPSEGGDKMALKVETPTGCAGTCEGKDAAFSVRDAAGSQTRARSLSSASRGRSSAAGRSLMAPSWGVNLGFPLSQEEMLSLHRSSPRGCFLSLLMSSYLHRREDLAQGADAGEDFRRPAILNKHL